MSEGKQVLERAFDDLERQLPASMARAIRRLRRPEARWQRVPIGVLAIVGGFFSFLPVLGLWMLPLGLLLLAYDIPILRKPVARFTIWGTRHWERLRAWVTGYWREIAQGPARRAAGEVASPRANETASVHRATSPDSSAAHTHP